MEEVILWANLGQDISKCKVRAVTLQDEWVVRIGNLQYRCGCKGNFELVEGRLASWRPVELGILLSQVMEGPCNPGELVNEPAIEVGKPNETLEFGDIPRQRPVCYGFDFGWVHRQAITGYKESLVFDFLP